MAKLVAFADAEDVLGIPITDPAVLKATQFILVCVSINVFSFIMELISGFDLINIAEANTFDIVWWMADLFACVVSVFSGYLGVRRSNKNLLALFVVVSFASCVECVVSGALDLNDNQPLGSVVLYLVEAFCYLVSVHQACFLWREARRRPLGEGPDAEMGRLGYSLLGMQMADLKVLRATQMLFASLGIVVGNFACLVILGAEAAITHPAKNSFWLFCCMYLVLLTVTSYIGVKKNHTTCLSALLALLVAFAFFVFALCVMLIVTCDERGCVTLICYLAGIAFSSVIATRNVVYLKATVSHGGSLTVLPKPINEGCIPPTQLGAVMGYPPVDDADDLDDFKAKDGA